MGREPDGVRGPGEGGSSQCDCPDWSGLSSSPGEGELSEELLWPPPPARGGPWMPPDMLDAESRVMMGERVSRGLGGGAGGGATPGGDPQPESKECRPGAEAPLPEGLRAGG